LQSAPTLINKYESAKTRELEYKGRPSIGDSHKRSMVELIPPVPFSINQSYNADREKQDAENKENKRQAKNEKFKANAVK